MSNAANWTEEQNAAVDADMKVLMANPNNTTLVLKMIKKLEPFKDEAAEQGKQGIGLLVDRLDRRAEYLKSQIDDKVARCDDANKAFTSNFQTSLIDAFTLIDNADTGGRLNPAKTLSTLSSAQGVIEQCGKDDLHSILPQALLKDFHRTLINFVGECTDIDFSHGDPAKIRTDLNTCLNTGPEGTKAPASSGRDGR